MVAIMSEQSMTRRRLGQLLIALAGVGPLSWLNRRSAQAAPWASQKRTVYRFDPTAERAEGSCATCAACQRHAEHKVFASLEAAEARRAHPGCRCAITTQTVDLSEYRRMFETSRRWTNTAVVGEFDRRWSMI